jgi:hypothetical protein
VILDFAGIVGFAICFVIPCLLQRASLARVVARWTPDILLAHPNPFTTWVSRPPLVLSLLIVSTVGLLYVLGVQIQMTATGQA